MAKTTTAAVAERVEKLEDVKERVATIETEMKWHRWAAGIFVVIALGILGFFGLEINNARNEVPERVRELLEKDVLEASRRSAEQAAAEAAKMRDSSAEVLVSAKTILEQLENSRNVVVRSVDGIRGAKPGETYTIMRLKEGASGLAVLSVSTSTIPSFTSFLVPYQCVADKAVMESPFVSFRSTPIIETIGSTTLKTLGLEIVMNIESGEVRMDCQLSKKDGLEKVFEQANLGDFLISVKLLLISDGPLPEVLTDIEQARVTRPPAPIAEPKSKPAAK